MNTNRESYSWLSAGLPKRRGRPGFFRQNHFPTDKPLQRNKAASDEPFKQPFHQQAQARYAGAKDDFPDQPSRVPNWLKVHLPAVLPQTAASDDSVDEPGRGDGFF